MSIKPKHILWGIEIICLLIILIIVFIPNISVLRVIIGVPFILFSPGYAIISVLFPSKNSLDSLEIVLLSFGTSIAIVALFGLLLSYTTWGMGLTSILICLVVFISVCSIFALIRQQRVRESEKSSYIPLKFPAWSKISLVNKILGIIMVITVLSFIVAIGFTLDKAKINEKFTEFYFLDTNGNTDDLRKVINLGDTYSLTLGIVNHEQSTTSYQLEVLFNNEQVSTIGPLVLYSGEKLEKLLSYTPQTIGDNQRLDFLLRKNGQVGVYLELHVWLSIK